MRFITTCLFIVSLATACLQAAAAPRPFPPNAAHANVVPLGLPQAAPQQRRQPLLRLRPMCTILTTWRGQLRCLLLRAPPPSPQL